MSVTVILNVIVKRVDGTSVFLGYDTELFSFQNNPKNLDLCIIFCINTLEIGCGSNYSRTSMTRTLMALTVSNSFLSPLEKISYSCRFGLI